MNNETEIKLVEGQFQRVSIGESDVIVVTCPDRLAPARVDMINRHVREFFDRPCIVFDGGIRFDVVDVRRLDCNGTFNQTDPK